MTRIQIQNVIDFINSTIKTYRVIINNVGMLIIFNNYGVIMVRMTGMQKLDAALAFVPGVSTVVGIVQAFVYFGRMGKHEKEMTVQQKKIQTAAQKINKNATEALNYGEIHTAATEKFKARDLTKQHLREVEMSAFAVMQIIPILNIIAAIYSLVTMSKLLEAKENFGKVDDQRLNKFLMKRYGVDAFDNDPVKQLALDNALKLIYAKFDAQHFRDYAIQELAKECRKLIEKEKGDKGIEGDGTQLLKTALKNLIVNRKNDEKGAEKKLEEKTKPTAPPAVLPFEEAKRQKLIKRSQRDLAQHKAITAKMKVMLGQL